jgi:hypothetical protein
LAGTNLDELPLQIHGFPVEQFELGHADSGQPTFPLARPDPLGHSALRMKKKNSINQRPKLIGNIKGASLLMLAVAIFAGITAPNAAAALVSVYTLDTDFSDSLGFSGNLVEFNNSSSSFGGGAWSWTATTNPGGGLIMDVPASISSVYSISLRMSLDRFYVGSLDAYVKLIDFKDRTSDNGLYLFENQISFFGSDSEYLGGTLTTNTDFDILLTRSASNEVNVYLDASATPIISFTDTAEDAVPTLVGGTSRFRLFHDDAYFSSSQQDEWSTGSVDEIRLWNTTVPEPSTTTLLIGGCGSLLLFRRRKTNTTI